MRIALEGLPVLDSPLTARYRTVITESAITIRVFHMDRPQDAVVLEFSHAEVRSLCESGEPVGQFFQVGQVAEPLPVTTHDDDDVLAALFEPVLGGEAGGA